MHSIFNQITHKNIVVIGDVMIDAYLNGEVKRISPEAPVPILDIKNRDYRLGGASNVALNIKTLGANTTLFSVVGNDGQGASLQLLLSKHGINDVGIITSNSRVTTTKFRLIGNSAQMMRVDEEDRMPLNSEEQTELEKQFRDYFNNHNIDAIVFEDYDKGVLTPNLIRTVIDLAKKKNIPMLVDPKRNNFHHYSGVTLFKPNLKEWCEALHLESETITLAELEHSAKAFAQQHNISYIMITLSAKGVAIWDRENEQFFHHPTMPREVIDVSGAGDSVIATASLAIINHLAARNIAILANATGGAVCQFAGVVPITQEMLRQEMKIN